MRTITICSFKGGVGKTSAALHIGACLAKYEGLRVLLVDFDSQANLSVGLGLGPDCLDTMVPVLRREKSIKEVVQETTIPNLSVVPANCYLDGIESTAPLVGDLYAHERLRKALQEVEYDICLIDTPPSLGWLTQSAFFAADHSIICCIPAAYSMLALGRLREYHETINENHPLEVLGVMMSFWDERGATNSAFLKIIDEAFPGKIFESKIRRDIAVSHAVFEGMPVTETDPQSRAAQDYRALSHEVAVRCGLRAEELVEV